MELTGRLLRWGAARPHLLLAEVPGGTPVRHAVERHARARGWPLADGPSDADVLVVCGTAGGALQEAVETTWQAMPGPRVRVELTEPADVPARLAQALTGLADPAAQRADAAQRPAGVPDDDTPEAEAEQDRPDHGDADGGEPDHGDMQMDMDMSLPGGLVMADRAADRDGLTLDVLHLRLGPFLPAWPAGLALDVVLQGDVVQSADVHTYDVPGARSAWAAAPALEVDDRRLLLAASHLDSAGRLLQLAGWAAAAEQAARLRDDALAGGPAPELEGQVHRLRTRVSRSWSLRWGLRGLGVLRAADAARFGVTGPALRADGDALDRLLQWLFETEQTLDGGGRPDQGPHGRAVDDRAPTAALLDALSSLVTGLEVAGVRLVVASLDPDVAELSSALAGRAGAGGARGPDAGNGAASG